MEAFNYFPHTCSEKKHFYSPFYCLLVFVRLPRKYSRYPFILWLHKTQKDWYAQKNNTNFRSHMGLDKHTADMQPQRANPVCWNMSEGAHPSEPWSYLAPLEKKASGSPPTPQTQLLRFLPHQLGSPGICRRTGRGGGGEDTYALCVFTAEVIKVVRAGWDK